MAISGEPSKSELPTSETAKSELSRSELPTVESPSISPASESAVEPVAAIEPEVAAAIERAIAPPAESPIVPAVRGFTLRPRHKRDALLAASVALAAALGAVIGVAASGGFATKAHVEAAVTDDRKAMEQSISRLAKEVGTLKTSLEAANKAANTQIQKITARFDRATSEELVTGSISAPQTVPVPVPAPRPAPRVAAVEAQPPARPVVVSGWTIHDARDGFVYVQGHGDIYQVVPGAPLPGLGPVESVKRLDGRWVVTTPKGIIVSMRDRRYFE